MSDQQTQSDAELTRQEAIAEFEAEYGADWAKDFIPGTFGCHELLDRVSVQSYGLELHVLEHAACVQDPEWYELAEQAAAALRELYQRIGAAHLGDDHD